MLLAGGETIEVAGISFEVVAVPGHSPGPPRVLRGRRAALGRRALRRLGRSHRPAARRLGRPARVDQVARRALSAGHGRLLRPRPADDARRRGRSATRSWPSSAGHEVRGVRGARTTSSRPSSRSGRSSSRAFEELCALYGYRPIHTPVFEDTELFVRTSGHGSDVVSKEMYTFTDRGDRSLTLRAEATAPIVRALPRARHAPRAAAREALHVRDDLPLRRPQKGRFREHWQLDLEAIGSDDPAVDAEVIQLYDSLLGRLGIDRVPARAELDRRPELPARRTWSAAAALARRARGRARRGDARAGKRATRCARSTTSRPSRRRCRRCCARLRRSATRSATRAASTSPRCGATSTPYGVRLRARADARPRPRLLHADDLGVRRPRRHVDERALRRRPLRRARRGAGRQARRRASASARGSSGCCSRSSTRAAPRPGTTASTSSSCSRRALTGPTMLAEMMKLRRDGARVAMPTTRAARCKGQLTQAGRLRRKARHRGRRRRRISPRSSRLEL